MEFWELLNPCCWCKERVVPFVKFKTGRKPIILGRALISVLKWKPQHGEAPLGLSWLEGALTADLTRDLSPWWNVLLFLQWKPLSYLFPWLGSQHPYGGILSLWRSELIIFTCVPVLRVWPCNKKKYALHGLISHRDHNNFNHIKLSNYPNMYIKPPFTQENAQIRYVV